MFDKITFIFDGVYCAEELIKTRQLTNKMQQEKTWCQVHLSLIPKETKKKQKTEKSLALQTPIDQRKIECMKYL